MCVRVCARACVTAATGLLCYRARLSQAEDNRSQTIYRGGKSSIWDTRLHELEDMGTGVSLYFQFLKVAFGIRDLPKTKTGSKRYV